MIVTPYDLSYHHSSFLKTSSMAKDLDQEPDIKFDVLNEIVVPHLGHIPIVKGNFSKLGTKIQKFIAYYVSFVNLHTCTNKHIQTRSYTHSQTLSHTLTYKHPQTLTYKHSHTFMIYYILDLI